VLDRKRLEREKMFERIPPEIPDESPGQAAPEPDILGEETSIWDLLGAFYKITRDFMPETQRKIVYDDTPVSTYVQRLLERLRAAPECRLAFSSLFECIEERLQVIGMFLAVLEAARQGALKIFQMRDGADIYIEFVPEDEREKRLQPQTQADTGEPAPEPAPVRAAPEDGDAQEADPDFAEEELLDEFELEEDEAREDGRRDGGRAAECDE
jgi:chromatin segregation and condensation protein Rec8/ScpA/Scc1 (kleisin family)